MLELGKRQSLTVVKTVDFGVYLSEGEGAGEEVLLPKKEVPEGTKTGDALEVFLYKDSKDRLIATREEAAIQLGEVALLKVAETGKIGAFLDWGLPKDLLLPFREQTRKVEPGDECLVALYIDKSSRLCATMKVYHYLKKESPYEKGDHVTGRIYEISNNFGAFVAVDDLSSRERIPEQMNRDAEEVLQKLDEKGGFFPFTDKADPELIKEELGLTKNAFKRAVGRLLKQRKIEISDGKIIKK